MSVPILISSMPVLLPIEVVAVAFRTPFTYKLWTSFVLSQVAVMCDQVPVARSPECATFTVCVPFVITRMSDYVV